MFIFQNKLVLRRRGRCTARGQCAWASHRRECLLENDFFSSRLWYGQLSISIPCLGSPVSSSKPCSAVHTLMRRYTRGLTKTPWLVVLGK